MSIYIDLLLVAAIATYIVDVSGFTDSWREALQKWLKVKSLRNLKPFDCGKCMTWWSCLIYALFTGHFCLETIAFSALLSLLSFPMGNIMGAIQEDLLILIDFIVIRR